MSQLVMVSIMHWCCNYYTGTTKIDIGICLPFSASMFTVMISKCAVEDNLAANVDICDHLWEN